MPDDPRLEADLRAAEARFYHALRHLHDGGLAPLLAAWSRRDDVTSMNAAGGHEQGPEAVQARWAWWRAQGRPMPATKVEHLTVVATAELAYTVALEHHGERVLRVTHVYGREEGTWKLLHRHADPLVQKQD